MTKKPNELKVAGTICTHNFEFIRTESHGCSPDCRVVYDVYRCTKCGLERNCHEWYDEYERYCRSGLSDGPDAFFEYLMDLLDEVIKLDSHSTKDIETRHARLKTTIQNVLAEWKQHQEPPK